MSRVFAVAAVLGFQMAITVTIKAQGTVPGPDLVSVTEGTITMPTYDPVERDSQPPLFSDSAVTGLYPFPTYSTDLKPGPNPRTYKTIFLENQYLKLTYAPQLGGRFLSLYDKLRKREVFYKNDVFKPTRFNARGNWIQEGIELTGPFDVHSLTLKGEPAWSSTVIRHVDGSVTLMLSEVDPIYGMNISLSATLYPAVAAMQISVYCFNPNTSRMPQMFWTNASFPATRDTRFIYPMTRTVGHNSGQVTDWPVYDGVDLSWDRNNKNMLGVFGIDLYDDFGGAYQFDQDYGVFRFADRRVVQGMKMWTFGHGRDAASSERSYTDKAGPYFEAQSGRHVWDGHYEWVGPHQVEEWSEWWIPVAGIKGMSTMTRDVALNLQVQSIPDSVESSLQLYLSSVRSFEGAKLTVRSNKGELLAQEMNLNPGTPVHRTIEIHLRQKDVKELEVMVKDADGTTLLDYHRPDPGDNLSEYTAFTKQLDKPVTPPEAMGAEELSLAAEFQLKELDTKAALKLLALAIEKDAGYSVAHTLKGIIFYKEARLHEAEAELQKAVERDPYADRAWYYLSMAQLGLGQGKVAERSLYYIWPSSAYYGNREYQLGRMSLIRADYAGAISHLYGAINQNGQDVSAHQLLAMAYREKGDANAASSEIAKLLEIDPSNRGAYAERFFLTKSPSAKAELKRLMSNQSQEAIHVAETYSSLNRWHEAAVVLQMEENQNSDPWGTSGVFYYTLAYDLKLAGEISESAVNLKKARAAGAVVDRFPYLSSTEAPLADAITLDPQDVFARFDLGCLLYYLGRHDEAIAQWEAAATIQPSNFSVQRGLGLAYAERGETARAVAKLEKAVAINGSHLGTVNDLVTLYARAGRFPDEIALLQKALQRSPENDDLTLSLLHVDLMQGHYDEADKIVLLHRFSPRHRDDQLRDAYRTLRYAEGSRAFAKGDYAQALDLFRAAGAPPDSLGVDDFQFQSMPRLHYYLGRTYEALNRKSEAKQSYEQSVKEVDLTVGDRATFNSDNFFMLLSLERLGRIAEVGALSNKFEAFAKSQLSLARLQRRSEGQYLLALISANRGNPEEAARQMESALKIEPDFLAPRLDLRGDSIGVGVLAIR